MGTNITYYAKEKKGFAGDVSTMAGVQIPTGPPNSTRGVCVKLFSLVQVFFQFGFREWFYKRKRSHSLVKDTGAAPLKRRRKMPAFRTKKEVHDWITSGRKTIELRKGKAQNGESIAFLNGRNQTVRGRILRKREGNIGDLLNAATYKRIVPTARTLDEAMEFIKHIYFSLEGTFTTYEFEIEDKKQS